MSKRAFRDDLRLSKPNISRLSEIVDIIDEYLAAGYKMTLRQLYYQLVSRGIIANAQAEYKKLGTLLVKGRMAGYVDWAAIEDRVREPKHKYWVNGVHHALLDTVRQYRLDRQKGQDTYIEVWCEKDALSQVLKRVTEHYHVRLMVNRGYSSCTAMHDAAVRIAAAAKKTEQNQENSLIIYIGDHDPSGLDMIRDIRMRLQEFWQYPEVRHIALTTEQVNHYKPPPNPAKITDPRAKWYMEEYGELSWEVDALDPKILDTLLREEIERAIDLDLFEKVCEQEEMDQDEITRFAQKYEEEK